MATVETLADRINNHLAAGGRVVIATYTRATVYDQRHAGWFSVAGYSLYVRHGRGKVSLGLADRPSVGIRFVAE